MDLWKRRLLFAWFFSQNIHWTNLREHWTVSEKWLAKGPNSIVIAIYLFVLDVAQSTKIIFFTKDIAVKKDQNIAFLLPYHSHGKFTRGDCDGIFPHDCHCGFRKSMAVLNSHVPCISSPSKKSIISLPKKDRPCHCSYKPYTSRQSPTCGTY